MKNKTKNINNLKKSSQITINIFDVLSVAIVVFLIGFFVYSNYFYKKPETKRRIYVSVRIPSENILDEAKKQRIIYLNSVNEPVIVSDVRKEDIDIILVLEGPGEIRKDSYFFNGQRILVGQKAEIHSTYFAQGKIISVSNEFK